MLSFGSSHSSTLNITRSVMCPKFYKRVRYERGKDREVFTTSGTYPWSFVTQIFHKG
jgi:hypothetical protein